MDHRCKIVKLLTGSLPFSDVKGIQDLGHSAALPPRHHGMASDMSMWETMGHSVLHILQTWWLKLRFWLLPESGRVKYLRRNSPGALLACARFALNF